ncbi:MAG: 30S ribosomal protein S6 [Candidatus Kaelpia aquatica]|nr:30S ribosomal protein S6 [Candidatus Kaelpia aquatica]
MKKYEIMLILNPDMSETDVDSQISKIKDSVAKLKGKVVQLDIWQRRRLAYSIEKFQEGIYLLGNFEMPEEIVKVLSGDWKLNPNILRSMILKKEKEKEIVDAQSK